VENASYAAIQSLAEAAFDPNQFRENTQELARHYNEFHALFVQVGKDYCGPVARCEKCPLRYDLPASRSRRGSP
jgi:endonuclease III-like uncharacterized protein